MRARRVVTGEVDGRAVVVSDEAVDPITISLVPAPESLDPDHPGMHRTATVDFDVIVSGEAWLGLDDGVEVLCRQGDGVVVNGQRHAWTNRSAEPCVMVSACIGGLPAAP